MKYLVQGMETTKTIDILISTTKIESERKIKALHHHFVKGIDIGYAAQMCSLPQPNLTDVIQTLNEIAEPFEKYYEARINSMSSSLLTTLAEKAKERELNN